MPTNLSRSPSIIVVGGSAGGIEALKTLLASIAAPAAPAVLPMLVVIHTGEAGGQYLPQILSRVTPLVVGVAADGETVQPGHVYVAPSGRHLKIVDGRIELNRGMREHHTRPAVDVLFRSAARSHGDRVLAVILSGHGSDGSAGALAIHARGGRIIAQSPDEALARSMPQRAIDTAGADMVATAHDIGKHLGELAATPLPPRGAGSMIRDDDEVSAAIQGDIQEQIAGKRDGALSVLSCPDCGGVLWQMDSNRHVDFQCHIGHRYSADTMLVEKTEQLEAALVSALRLLKEKAILLRQTAERARQRGDARAAERLGEQAALDQQHADVLQRQLLEGEPSSLSNAAIEDEVARQLR
jgi:two-component system chemotaxis response regulator CheB